jgi:hypothetical protein
MHAQVSTCHKYFSFMHIDTYHDYFTHISSHNHIGLMGIIWRTKTTLVRSEFNGSLASEQKMNKNITDWFVYTCRPGWFHSANFLFARKATRETAKASTWFVRAKRNRKCTSLSVDQSMSANRGFKRYAKRSATVQKKVSEGHYMSMRLNSYW